MLYFLPTQAFSSLTEWALHWMSTSKVKYFTDWVLNWMSTSLNVYFTEWVLLWMSSSPNEYFTEWVHHVSSEALTMHHAALWNEKKKLSNHPSLASCEVFFSKNYTFYMWLKFMNIYNAQKIRVSTFYIKFC